MVACRCGDSGNRVVQVSWSGLGEWAQLQTAEGRFVAEARKRMMLVWAMGMRRGELPADDCCRVWNALVRPVLEYGAVIWGDVKWEEAEAVQREMGKMILRCSSKMANVVLGVDAQGSKRPVEVEVLGKIVSKMSSSRLVKQVYEDSRAHYEAGQSSRWCKYTHALLTELGMEEVWQQGTLACDERAWDKEVREKYERGKGMAYEDANKTKTLHIHHIETQTPIRTVPHTSRHRSTSSDDTTERRNERIEN